MLSVPSLVRLAGGLVLALIGIGASPLISGAVLIAPHAIFIDHRARTAQFTLANPSDRPEEVEIDFRFGYPETDSLGNPYVRLFDEPGPDFPSAAGWMRAYPRRVRLEPGQRQVVRLLATPPPDLEDREYWSRVIVTSRRGHDLAVRADSGVRAGITLELRTIIALTYRKGAVHTGVALTDLEAVVDGDSLHVWTALQREGNAAYLGAIRLVLEDAEGRTVRRWETAVAVYYSLRRRLALPLEGLAPGRYRLQFELSTARDDIPSSRVLPAATRVRSIDIDVS